MRRGAGKRAETGTSGRGLRVGGGGGRIMGLVISRWLSTMKCNTRITLPKHGLERGIAQIVPAKSLISICQIIHD